MFCVPAYGLSGKAALVTGATRGIGYAVAAALASAGAKVAVTSRKADDCARVQSEFADRGLICAGIAADASRPEETQALISEVAERFGGLDILVNNAGIGGKEAPIFDVTSQDWDETHGIDLKGVYFCARAAALQMKSQGTGGAIINMASAAGILAPKYVSVYGAAKAAVVHLTKIMANEWARYGIRVNAIAPGYIATDMTKDVMADEKNAAAVLKKIGMRRFGETRDIASAALFLASGMSSYITGTILPVDGGMTIN
ncbi:MAG: SDR family oxidoreductase [Oscillospiraceae bacterium]|jgi:NAD(P)-dependent dehydrogenase (short-subunit alcohol dehydrogenase family)|nr:SDR family oxidoreductase [Oscillospiraceae bacterium]